MHDVHENNEIHRLRLQNCERARRVVLSHLEVEKIYLGTATYSLWLWNEVRV